MTATGNLLPNRDGAFRYANEMHNLKMFDFVVDGDGNLVPTADPTSQDYTNGQFEPIYVVAFGLTQHAVDVLCRRTFAVACHAVKVVKFTAPLVLVTDPADTHQTNPRPLRYYDPVYLQQGGVDAQFLVRNCNPHVRRDRFQWAEFELQSTLID